MGNVVKKSNIRNTYVNFIFYARFDVDENSPQPVS